jgi:hypothetical protein
MKTSDTKGVAMPTYLLWGTAGEIADPQQHREYPSAAAALADFSPPDANTCAVLLEADRLPQKGEQFDVLSVMHVFQPGKGWRALTSIPASWFDLWM